MPSDIVGAEILNEQRHFQFIKGPIFANIILADEINRTPPKTQAGPSRGYAGAQRLQLVEHCINCRHRSLC